ncbi:unnamed protein product [Symbiodinium microadriaticum]|nr:unnamed protein product [Symbiodinium microadriaticum]CAE7697943.1 unnamed protein product [Symbiodinium sp. KB8]
MDVENSRVRCRFDSPGQLQQQFQLCPYLGSAPSAADSRSWPPESLKLVNAKTFNHRPLKDGDVICLLARSGCFLGVCSSQVGEGTYISSGPSLGRQWVRADFADGASPQCAFVLRTAGAGCQVLDRCEITLQNLASSQVMGHCDGEANPHSLVSTALKFDRSVVDCRLFVEKAPGPKSRKPLREAAPSTQQSIHAVSREASTWLVDGVDLKPVAMALSRSFKPLRSLPRCWELVALALPIYYKSVARGRRRAAPGHFLTSPPYTLVEHQDRALRTVADMAAATSASSPGCLVLVDGIPFFLSDAEIAKLDAKSKARQQKVRSDTVVVYRSSDGSDVPLVLIDGEYFAAAGIGGGHSLLTTAPSGIVALLCRLPRSLVKDKKQEIWAGRPRYRQCAAYVVTIDVGSVRNRGLKLEQAVSCKMVSSECQCGPLLPLSITSRIQRVQLQLEPKIFNVFGLAEVAVCLVMMDHSIIGQDGWRMLGYTLVTVRQRRGAEALLASAARLVIELGSWEEQLPLAHASSARELVHEAKDDVMRLITGELSKPGFSDHELSFFKGELRRLSGSKEEPREGMEASEAAIPLTSLATAETAEAPGIAELRRQLSERVEALLLRLRQGASTRSSGS